MGPDSAPRPPGRADTSRHSCLQGSPRQSRERGGDGGTGLAAPRAPFWRRPEPCRGLGGQSASSSDAPSPRQGLADILGKQLWFLSRHHPHPRLQHRARPSSLRKAGTCSRNPRPATGGSTAQIPVGGQEGSLAKRKKSGISLRGATSIPRLLPPSSKQPLP